MQDHSDLKEVKCGWCSGAGVISTTSHKDQYGMSTCHACNGSGKLWVVDLRQLEVSEDIFKHHRVFQSVYDSNLSDFEVYQELDDINEAT